jgi:hypothetical protein
MAGLFSKITNIFGGQQKRDTTPQIEQFAMPQQTAAGGTALPLLQSRAQGQGVGFTPEQLSMYGQPYAKSVQDYWTNKAQPAIDESWSSRGLGRSSMAGQANIQGQQDVANMIGTNWADLNKWNEEMKQQGVQNALSGLLGFTDKEMNAGQMNTEKKWEDYYNQLTLADQQKRRQQGAYKDMAKTGVNLLTTLAGKFGGGGVNPAPKTNYLTY